MISDLASRIGCEFIGENRLLHGASTISEAGANELTFLSNKKYVSAVPDCEAGAIIVSPEVDNVPEGVSRIISSNPYDSFRQALEIMYPENAPIEESSIHPEAIVSELAEVGDKVRISSLVRLMDETVVGSGTSIEHGTFVGKNSRIGSNCIIGVNVSIRENVEIGDRVIIGDNSVLGFDGFGYVPGPDGWQKIKPVGSVVIEDDVEIGANCCIDRATVGATRIGKGSKLDNLIQIAHGVQIGENTAIAAQTGISGSTQIGSRVMIGGQVGMVGHIEIGDDMIVGAQAGVTKSFDEKGMISGYPARTQSKAMRIEASLQKLPDLLKRVRKIENRLEDEEKDK